MTRDQQRVLSEVVPLLTAASGDELKQRDCTVLSRLFLQGADPLFLMEVCPEGFAYLCAALDLEPASGRDAIERAHVEGPGILLDGTGLPVDFLEEEDKDPHFKIPESWKREALWLLLASCSGTTEEGYAPSVSITERILCAAKSVAALTNYIAMLEECGRDPIERAIRIMRVYRSVSLELVDGIPTTNTDIGFYAAYKAGYLCAAVRQGDHTFFGTVPETTLAEQGITVDVEISPSYGFRRGRV